LQLYKQKTEKVNCVREILVTLATRLQPDITATLKQLFDMHVKQQGDLSQQLYRFFKESEEALGGDNSIILKLLKCLNLDIVFPAIHHIRSQLYTELPYKDLPNSWTTYLMFANQTKKSDCNTIVITHRKKERAHDPLPQNYFQFEWVVIFTFNRNMSNFKQVDVRIVDYTFHEQTSPATRQLVQRALTRLYKPGVQDTTGAVVNPQELVQTIISKLLECNPPIQAYHSNFPHSLQLTELLITLSKYLKQNKDKNEWELPDLIKIGYF